MQGSIQRSLTGGARWCRPIACLGAWIGSWPGIALQQSEFVSLQTCRPQNAMLCTVLCGLCLKKKARLNCRGATCANESIQCTLRQSAVVMKQFTTAGSSAMRDDWRQRARKGRHTQGRGPWRMGSMYPCAVAVTKGSWAAK